MTTMEQSKLKELTCTVNGQVRHLYIKPSTLLVEVLRNDLGLTATKRGCESASCGACTVILNGLAVKSCTVLAMQADGGDIQTVEGMAEGGTLHPLQRAFFDYGAYQCGFCTSGMLNSLRALLEKNPKPTEEEIRTAIDGNICRCTGYAAIIRAVNAVANGEYGEEA